MRAGVEADDAEAVARRRPGTPLWAHARGRWNRWERLARTIRATFDPAGQIRDDVSPELARLRREREAVSGRVRGEIERLMQDETFAAVMQDQFWTIRQDRYVLPLKASAKSMGLGIVHDSSRTGETVFVEPVAIVALNNRVKLCDLEIERESPAHPGGAGARTWRRRRLRCARTWRSWPSWTSLRPRRAWAWTTAAAPGMLVDDTFVDLRQARHPLLVLRAAREAFQVVANDMALGGRSPRRVLVVSGPNAGGKTVILKTVGLAALMARAGMLLPAAPGSRMGFFSLVLPDIGDRQSVMGDLSTFSAHLANLAGDPGRGRRAAGKATRSRAWCCWTN